MAYELWDRETANLLGAYETKDAALNDVRALLEARGREAVALLALAFEDRHGDTHPIASGTRLVELAEIAAVVGAS